MDTPTPTTVPVARGRPGHRVARPHRDGPGDGLRAQADDNPDHTHLGRHGRTPAWPRAASA